MTLTETLHEYGKSHQNRTNQLIHFLCVPLIVASTLGLAWLVNLRLLGVEGPLGVWVNLATIGSALAMLYYIRFGIKAILGMAVFAGLSFAAIIGIQSAGWSLLWVAGVVWVLSWALQIYGHKIEGAKPSFAEDMQFFLVGPLFVLDELGYKLRAN